MRRRAGGGEQENHERQEEEGNDRMEEGEVEPQGEGLINVRTRLEPEGGRDSFMRGGG